MSCASLGGTALAVAAVFALACAPASGSSRPVAYCSIPSGTETWGFHAGAPIQAATGTYAHGHGTLSGQTASGVICQVDRVRGAADRQIILSVGPKLISLQHAVTVNGTLGNQMRLKVRVRVSTDPQCKVGTVGKVTLFASYNGVHKDSVQFSFPNPCRRHRHYYSGSAVAALVPP